ncbi:unnamed protein product [Mytilus coruscus]|uniref:CUB domain-containing protein n=1 Tax=Mytilus coruscus TaxID=42192 RepID=A0A6J8CJS9_MYTCO|nr:unnamed protein product [Mytilus coruscus]
MPTNLFHIHLSELHKLDFFFQKALIVCTFVDCSNRTDAYETLMNLYYDIKTKCQINETACLLSPCSQDHKCIVSRQNKAFCITTVGELIFMETLKSTNYPAAYPNYDVQSWTLAVQNNSRLVLRFQAFHLETNNDFLKIYDKQGGRQMYSLTGLYNRDDIWSKTNGFFITFTSDYSITFSGFSIDVYKTS